MNIHKEGVCPEKAPLEQLKILVSSAVRAYRWATHSAIGHSPFEVVFGQRPSFGLPEEEPAPGEAVGFLNELVEKNGLPAGVYSKWDLSAWCAEKGIKLLEGELLSPKGGEALEYSLI